MRIFPTTSEDFQNFLRWTKMVNWVERGIVRVKCLAQEHNTISLARARTWIARSGVELTNLEVTAPPTRFDHTLTANLRDNNDIENDIHTCVDKNDILTRGISFLLICYHSLPHSVYRVFFYSKTRRFTGKIEHSLMQSVTHAALKLT